MKIHFIGIGGIGVSALAQYYLKTGHRVSGSDLVCSEITELLKEMGAQIIINPKSQAPMTNQIPNPKLQTLISPDLVIFSPAVKEDNLELKEARKQGIKCLSYPEALGELTKKYFTIAISGTHGKSTTTAMLALVLIEAGLDPTAIIGTKLKEFGNTNFRLGQGKYLVIEADEWNGSFLNYWPKIIVLTNIEEEHLDYYKDLEHILKTYREYLDHLPKDGVLVVNKDDENTLRMLNSKSEILNSKQYQNPKSKIQNFSKKQKEFEQLKKVLKIPGEHNVYNALAVLTAARVLAVSDEVSFKALSNYKGSWRRFEIIKGKALEKEITIISDYGHHPTEIRATLGAVREKFASQRIWLVYQPHQEQRTFYLFNDFVKVFSSVPIDNIIITDIYDVAGREQGEIRAKVSSERLVESINRFNVIYLAKEKIKPFLERKLEDGDILVIMGAGDIYELVSDFST